MKRIIDEKNIETQDLDISLRPQSLSEYVGQTNLKVMLDVYIKATLNRNEVLDHVLLYGPPGLGKTTLAHIIANEMNSNIKIVSAPGLEKPGDLATVLSSLDDNDILFIDEIHRLSTTTEELLYSAMEDFVLDIMVGKDASSKNIRIQLPKFTLVGATTRYGEMSSPLRDRFGIIFKLEYYKTNELVDLLNRTSKVLSTAINNEACLEIAKRSRATPRISNRLFRRIRDFAQVKNNGIIDLNITKYALDLLNIDDEGLDKIDYKYLDCLTNLYNGGPVGLETISVTIAEDSQTVEDVYEPYLIQQGFISRSPRGRIATNKAINYKFKFNKE